MIDNKNQCNDLSQAIGQLQQQLRAGEKAQRQQCLTQALLNAVDLEIALIDDKGTIIALNDAWEAHKWYEAGSSIRLGDDLIAYCRQAETDPVFGQTAMLVSSGLTDLLQQKRAAFSLEFEQPKKTGSDWYLLKAHPLHVEHFSGAVVSRLDITRRKQAELLMQQRHDRIATKVRQSVADLQLFEKIFHSALEGITVTDSSGTIINVNDAFTRITGYSREEALGQNPRILKSDRHTDDYYRQMWNQLVSDGVWEGEIWNRRKNGEVYPEWLSINAITVPEDGTINYVAVFHDITQLKEKEARIEHLAYRDALTGLPNRALMLDRLEMALKRAERGKSGVAVLFVDIDNFRHINDSLGHPIGDQLLCEVANYIAGQLRSSDTIARIGGDEFVIISLFSQHTEVLALADRIHSSFKKFFPIADHSFYVTLSMGIAVSPDDGESVHRLIQNADLALHQAKAQGKNCYRLFDSGMNTRLVERLKLENELRDALKQGDIQVYYQPQINLKSGRVVGFEALARWTRRDGTLVPPDQFIPVAEESGMIDQLGMYVLDQACRQTRELAEAGFGGLRVSVNLSAVQFRDSHLASKIIGLITALDFDPAHLELEVTESLMMNNLAVVEKTLNELAQKGIRISIDDFGTGYSSLTYIKRFPISALKIDRSFIRDIAEDLNDRAIVEAILDMARALKLETVAEGVEEVRHQLFLAEHHCDLVQGYLYSRPLPYSQLLDFLKSFPGTVTAGSP